jgi:hypothetical protein
MESTSIPTKYQQVVVDVPEDRVAEFHALFARFLGGPTRRGRGGRRRGWHGHRGPHGRACARGRESAEEREAANEGAGRSEGADRPEGTAPTTEL